MSNEILVKAVEALIRSYENNPRGINEDKQCVYLHPETKVMCAIGTMFTPKTLDNYKNSTNSIRSICDSDAPKGFMRDKLFKPPFNNLPLNLLVGIQRLHDNPAYWENHQLSTSGFRNLEIILQHIRDLN